MRGCFSLAVAATFSKDTLSVLSTFLGHLQNNVRVHFKGLGNKLDIGSQAANFLLMRSVLGVSLSM